MTSTKAKSCFGVWPSPHLPLTIEAIGSFWGQISNYFRPDDRTSATAEFDTEEAERQRKLHKEMSRVETEHAESKEQRSAYSEPSVRRSGDPILDEKYKIIEEQDKDLDAFLDTLQDIKLRARQMNALLDSSNNRLEDMRTRGERADSRVVHQTKLATKYAK